MTDLIAELRAAIEAARVPDLMTPSQGAEYLGVSEIHLCQLRKERRGPPFLAISPIPPASAHARPPLDGSGGVCGGLLVVPEKEGPPRAPG